jgi:3-oxoacyl-[acyl-carrier-protein] synthase III
MTALITGVGAAVPKNIINNQDLSYLGIDDRWITSRTGISSRHRIDTDDRLIDFALVASNSALHIAQMSATEIDFILVATSTPDRISPGLAPELGYLLGANSPGTIDLSGACTGFLYGLDFAASRIESGRSHNILVIGADAMTRLTNRNDRNTAVLFGDGAGAVVVSTDNKNTVLQSSFYFGSAGGFASDLFVSKETGYVEMHGGEIYAHAIAGMVNAVRSLLSQRKIQIEDIDRLICHQANFRIIDSVLRELNWPSDKATNCVAEFGNTSAASIPIALAYDYDHGRIREDQQLAMSAFGAGLTWGAGLICSRLFSSEECRSLKEV